MLERVSRLQSRRSIVSIMDILKHNKAKICVVVIFAPWLVISLLLVWMEIQKLHLDHTMFMNKEQRKVYYLKIAMPGLSDDYFDLLHRATKRFRGRRLPYGIYVLEDLPPFVNLMCRNYDAYALSPSRRTTDEDKMAYKLFYRKAPSASDGKIVDVIHGSKPSYIVEVNPK